MAQDELNLDRVVFIPCYWPPHKDKTGILKAQHRFDMVRLAISQNPKFEVSDVEIKRKGKSYTVDTLLYFQKILPPQAELFFIIGGDMAGGLKSWQRIQEIKKNVTFIVLNRPGSHPKELPGFKFYSLETPIIDISSSFLRHRISKGKTIRYFVPDTVLQYINKHSLFKNHEKRGTYEK